jgi:quercetin dioxygenase-like cupin family protein
MPFVRFDDLEKEYVTPQHSTAYGESITGESIEVGRLTFKKGEGAKEHSHPQEQIMCILSGRVRAELAGETRELGPGEAFHALPNQPHRVTALEDSMVLSTKNTINGIGHKMRD